MKKIILSVVIALSSIDAFAEFAYVIVPNASTLKWQIAGNAVYLRNLNDYDASFLGCCYNYSIDLTVPYGKAMWATILLKMGTGAPISLGMERTVAGPVTQIGNF
jgi:hypothetical protein